MARFVDAEKLEDWVREFHPADAYWAISMLQNAPTADVEAVVRCKDCKYCGTIRKRYEIKDGLLYFCRKLSISPQVKPDGYCSEGVRRSK